MDGSTRRAIATAIVDDHCTPAILAPSDKPPIVAWTHHSADTSLRYKKGTTNNDLSSLGSVQTITCTSAVSYTQLYRDPGTDTVLVLFRLDASGDQDIWAFRQSSNYGTSWGSQTSLFDFEGEQGYIATTQDGTTLHCAVTGNPSSTFQDVGYFAVNLNTGAITNAAGSSLGNLSGTNLPLTLADVDLAHDAGVGETTRLFDVSPDREIVLASIVAGVATYRVKTWNGSSWDTDSLGLAGVPFDTTDYYGGASFAAGGEVYLARETSGVWTLERWTETGGVWSSAGTVAASHVPLVRPYCPVGQSSGPDVVGHKAWRYRSYTDYAGKAITPT